MKSRLLSALTIIFALLACGGIDGQLVVNSAMSLTDRKGDVYQIPTGNYKVNLNYKENKNRLTIEFDKLNGKKIKVETNTPEGFSIPENGNFSLRAQDYGQNVDLDGSVTTVRTESEEKYGRESCQYSDWETVCYTNPQGQTQCFQRQITRNGWRDIRYFDLTTVQTVKGDFSKNETTLAQFNARSSTIQQRVTWSGTCRW